MGKKNRNREKRINISDWFREKLRKVDQCLCCIKVEGSEGRIGDVDVKSNNNHQIESTLETSLVWDVTDEIDLMIETCIWKACQDIDREDLLKDVQICIINRTPDNYRGEYEVELMVDECIKNAMQEIEKEDVREDLKKYIINHKPANNQGDY